MGNIVLSNDTLPDDKYSLCCVCNGQTFVLHLNVCYSADDIPVLTQILHRGKRSCARVRRWMSMGNAQELALDNHSQ